MRVLNFKVTNIKKKKKSPTLNFKVNKNQVLNFKIKKGQVMTSREAFELKLVLALEDVAESIH